MRTAIGIHDVAGVEARPYMGTYNMPLGRPLSYWRFRINCVATLKASEWSYLATRMRCGAKLGGPDIQFGAYIVPRGPTGTYVRSRPSR
jgi:hypothetical protein